MSGNAHATVGSSAISLMKSTNYPGLNHHLKLAVNDVLLKRDVSSDIFPVWRLKSQRSTAGGPVSGMCERRLSNSSKKSPKAPGGR